MGSKWRKAKLALGLKLCVYVPPTLEDSPPSLDTTHSDAALLSSRPMMTPSPAASPCSRLLRSGSRSAKVRIRPYMCVMLTFFHCLSYTFIQSNVEYQLYQISIFTLPRCFSSTCFGFGFSLVSYGFYVYINLYMSSSNVLGLFCFSYLTEWMLCYYILTNLLV